MNIPVTPYPFGPTDTVWLGVTWTIGAYEYPCGMDEDNFESGKGSWFCYDVGSGWTSWAEWSGAVWMLRAGVSESTGLPRPEVFIPCGPQEICVEIENLGTYDEDVIINYELFEYQSNPPSPTSILDDYVEEFIECESVKEVCLFTHDFDEQGIYKVVVDIEMDPDYDCDTMNNGPIQLVIGVDCCPPESSAVISPEDPDGENNWYVSKVTVTVDAYDCCPPLVMSGVKEIKYEINGVPGTIAGDSGSFTVEDDGVNFVEFWAVDNAGNEEAEHHTFEVAIDRTAPTIDFQHSESQDDGGQWSVTLTAIAGDATSGLNRVVFKVGANVLDTLYTPPWEITEVWQSGWGGETFSATAYDNAGNSASDSAVITVSKDMSQTKGKTLVPTTINLLRLR
jgi:hypothetical protein